MLTSPGFFLKKPTCIFWMLPKLYWSKKSLFEQGLLTSSLHKLPYKIFKILYWTHGGINLPQMQQKGFYWFIIK